MAKCPCPLTVTAWSAKMQARALWVLSYTGILCLRRHYVEQSGHSFKHCATCC